MIVGGDKELVFGNKTRNRHGEARKRSQGEMNLGERGWIFICGEVLMLMVVGD